MPLITLSELRAVKPVSGNPISDSRYTAIIEDCEFKEIRPLLGSRFYQDLVRNAADANYVALLEGGEYLYDNFTYTNPGLTRVIIEFAYAHILFFGSEVNTPFGLVAKQYQDGQMATRDRTKELYTAHRQIANEYWLEVKAFLDRNYEDYEFWERCSSKTLNTIKLTHIR